MIYALVFGSYPVSSFIGIGWAELPCSAPNNLISRIAKEELEVGPYCRLPESIHPVFRDICEISLYLDKTKHSLSDDKRAQLILNKWRGHQENYMQTVETTPSKDFMPDEETLYKSAQLAAMLFFNLLDDNTTNQKTVIRNKLISDLKLALTGTGDVIWLKTAPMAFSWVCLTGAAVSEDSGMRGWFYFRQGSMARALNVDDASFIQDAWSYFRWLNQIAREGRA